MAHPVLQDESSGSAAANRPRRQSLCLPAGLARSLATRRAPTPLPAPPAAIPLRPAGPGQRPGALRSRPALPLTRAPRGADPAAVASVRAELRALGAGAAWTRATPSRPHPPRAAPPRGPPRLFLAVPAAIATRGVAGWGWGGRWVPARGSQRPGALPRQLCPAGAWGREDPRARLQSRICEALGKPSRMLEGPRVPWGLWAPTPSLTSEDLLLSQKCERRRAPTQVHREGPAEPMPQAPSLPVVAPAAVGQGPVAADSLHLRLTTRASGCVGGGGGGGCAGLCDC